jgi:hypothetical protein
MLCAGLLLSGADLQAELMDVDGDVEHKRARDGAGSSDAQQQVRQQPGGIDPLLMYTHHPAHASAWWPPQGPCCLAAPGRPAFITLTLLSCTNSHLSCACCLLPAACCLLPAACCTHPHAISHPQASSSSSDDEDLDPALAAALPVAADALGGGAAAAAAAGLHSSSSNSLAQLDHPSAGPRSIARPGFRERCKYIPLRLKLEERRLLRLLEAALNVSEYTDKVGGETEHILLAVLLVEMKTFRRMRLAVRWSVLRVSVHRVWRVAGRRCAREYAVTP